MEVSQIRAGLAEADAGDFSPHRKLRLCSTNGLRVQIKFVRKALRDLDDEAALVSYFQATFNTVQSFPNSVNAV